MATATRRKSVTTDRGSTLASEAVAIVLFLVAVLVFLCLVSHNPFDPTFNTSSGAPTRNWIGIFGANLSELLFSVVGVAAYVLPLLLALTAWRLFAAAKLHLSLIQAAGYVLFVGSLAALISLGGFRGGLFGSLVSGAVVAVVGVYGAVVLLAAVALIALLLITSLTISAAAGGVANASGWLWNKTHNLLERWQYGADNAVKADASKERESAVTKKQTKPTVLKGDAPFDSTPNVSIRDSVSLLFEDIRKGKPASATEKQELPPPSEADNAAEPPLIEDAEELPRPTILVHEEAYQQLSGREGAPPDLVALDEQIPITPMQQTGELKSPEAVTDDDAASDDAFDDDDVRELPPPPKKAQNFENYILPPTDFLTPAAPRIEQKDEELLAVAQELTGKTKEFNVTGRVMNICQGPVVTTYEFKPDPGVKYSRVTGLADDLCLALQAESIRIDRIPGKAYVGIEVPNRERETIYLREVIESKKFKESSSLLSIALGKSIDGLNYVADLTKMPHLLMAGQTGAGKSVGVNSIIVSILYKARPDEVKLIMVDPKQVELGIYADIPHLATPIIKDPKRAAVALKWAVGQMELRYRDLAAWGVRNLDGYNTEAKRRIKEGITNDDGELPKTLPYIVIIIDELADLMMVAGKEVEESITRLAQMARAVGIHLVLATQRPSVDVITGLIKANFPSRISFRVSSKVDSRTIVDANGAESLLGRGDMLFLPPGTSNLVRVHGAFVDETEITKIVNHIKAQGNPEYDTTITKTDEELDDGGDLPGRKDPLFWDAVKSVVAAKRASTSLLQRQLRIGYGRAAAILDAMVREGYIGEMDGSTRARPILQKAYEDLADIQEMNS